MVGVVAVGAAALKTVLVVESIFVHSDEEGYQASSDVVFAVSGNIASRSDPYIKN